MTQWICQASSSPRKPERFTVRVSNPNKMKKVETCGVRNLKIVSC